jgi:AsmA protein
VSRNKTISLALAIILLIPVIALAILILTFNPDWYRPQLAEAIEHATGRRVSLGGPIKLELSVVPTIALDNVSLSNPPGFADTTLLSIGSIEARFKPLPLFSHHLEIMKLVLTNPDVTLETSAAGQADWDLGSTVPARVPTSAPQPAPVVPGKPFTVALDAVEVQNGLVTIKSPSGTQLDLAVKTLTGRAASATSPLTIDGQALYNSVPITLAGLLGPLERFSGAGSGPWPVNLSLTALGATMSVQGGIASPQSGRGYDFTLTADIPALETLAPLFYGQAGRRLPPIHNIAGTIHLLDQGSPAFNAVSFSSGPSNLSSAWPGLAMTSATIKMVSLDQPITVAAAGALSGMPVSIVASIAPGRSVLGSLLGPAGATAQPSATLSVQVRAGDASTSISGGVTTPAKLAGVALAVDAAIPDLAELSGLAGAALPHWKNVNLQATLTDPNGSGLGNNIGLNSVSVTMDNAAFGGDANLVFGGAQPALNAAISLEQVNLDALLAALPAHQPPTASLTQAAPPPANIMIPDVQVPVSTMKSVAADVRLSADAVIYNNAKYSGLEGHATLTNGVLSISPVSGQLPGGSFSGAASVDASKSPAAIALSMTGPALALSPFLKAVGLPDIAQGTIQVRMNLSGSGDDSQGIAKTLSGQIGLAMVDGIVDGSVLEDLFGAALRTVGLPESLVVAQGPVAVRCFAARIDASDGTGTIRALTLDSDRLKLQGGGTIAFGPETLGIILRPELRIAEHTAGIPVQIDGTFHHQTTSLASLAALQSAAAAAPGLLGPSAESSSMLGNIVNALGLDDSGDVCPAALALGRLGQPGPAAPPSVTTTPGRTAEPTQRGPKSLLDSLFGK